MISYRNLAVVATVILVTLPLLYFSLRPVYMVDISIQPTILRGVMLFSRNIHTKPNNNGVVFFDVDGYVENPSISRVMFSLKPASDRIWYAQGEYEVSKGIFLGTAQLGSEEWPVRHDEQQSFRLISSDSTLLSQGNLFTRVQPVAGADQWLIAAIGLLASVLQILSFFFSNRKTERKL